VVVELTSTDVVWCAQPSQYSSRASPMLDQALLPEQQCWPQRAAANHFRQLNRPNRPGRLGLGNMPRILLDWRGRDVDLFVQSARFAYRSGGRKRLVELLSAVPFGCFSSRAISRFSVRTPITRILHQVLGSVPVAIALAWAMIITFDVHVGPAPHPAPAGALRRRRVRHLLDLSLVRSPSGRGSGTGTSTHAGFFGVPPELLRLAVCRLRVQARGPDWVRAPHARGPGCRGCNGWFRSPRT